MSTQEHLIDRIRKPLCEFIWWVFFVIMVFTLLFSCSLFVFTIILGGSDIYSWIYLKQKNDVINETLHFIELLLLSPIPFMVGVQLFNWTLTLKDRIDNNETAKPDHSGMISFAFAKSLVIGLMISIIGVKVVEKLLSPTETQLTYYIGAVISIIALVVFYFFLQKESSNNA
jgi:hypothetical protein